MPKTDKSTKNTKLFSIDTLTAKLQSNKEVRDLYESWQKRAENRFHTVGFVNQGGVKSIYRVHDKVCGRTSAMAMLSDFEPPEEVKNRFMYEAHITALLEHPNIVPVHDIGYNKSKNPYFTMKLIGGENLGYIIKQLGEDNALYKRKYPTPYLLDIFIHVCNAIAFAHSKNVLHLDIKPENIQVGDFGEVLVLDWGLAKYIPQHDLEDDNGGVAATITDTSITQEHLEAISKSDYDGNLEATLDGMVKGSPGFMSPEQAAGENSRRDERTDIYSLGAILYSILTYEKPVEGDTVKEILMKTAVGDIRSPQNRTPKRNIPTALEAVTKKAMSIEPSERYQTVKEIIDDITSYKNGYATSVENAGLMTQIWLLLKRRKTEASILIISMIIVVIFFTISFIKVNESRMVAERHLRETQRQRSELADTLLKLRQEIYQRKKAEEIAKQKAEAEKKAKLLALKAEQDKNKAVQDKNRAVQDKIKVEKIAKSATWKAKKLAKEKEQVDKKVQELAKEKQKVEKLVESEKKKSINLAKQKDLAVKIAKEKEVAERVAHRKAEAERKGREIALKKAMDATNKVNILTAEKKKVDRIVATEKQKVKKLAAEKEQVVKRVEQEKKKAAKLEAEKAQFVKLAEAEKKKSIEVSKKVEQLSREKAIVERKVKEKEAAEKKAKAEVVRLSNEQKKVITTLTKVKQQVKQIAEKEKQKTAQVKKLEQEKRTLSELAAREFLEKAKFLWAQHNYNKAIHYADLAINNDPKLKEAYNLRGKLYLKDLRFKDAGSMFVKAKRTDIDIILSPYKAVANKLNPLQAKALAEQLYAKRYWRTACVMIKHAIQSFTKQPKQTKQAILKSANKLIGRELLSLAADPENFSFKIYLDKAHLTIVLTGFISNLSPLKGIPVNVLNIKTNAQLQDLSALVKLPLKQLDLEINSAGPSNLDFLNGIKLSKLSVISQTDIDSIKALKNMPLTHLKISNLRGIKDLKILTNTPLQRLELINSRFSNINPLRSMKLKYLVISQTQIKDLSPLAKMPLTHLDVSKSEVTNLSPIRHLSLKSLNLAETKVVDLTPLKSMPLQTLDLCGTPIKDISPLSSLPLKKLDLCDCENIKDLSPIAKCTLLESLSIPYQIHKFDFLNHLKKLKYLDVERIESDDQTVQHFMGAIPPEL